jgi:hypothetical protein
VSIFFRRDYDASMRIFGLSASIAAIFGAFILLDSGTVATLFAPPKISLPFVHSHVFAPLRSDFAATWRPLVLGASGRPHGVVRRNKMVPTSWVTPLVGSFLPAALVLGFFARSRSSTLASPPVVQPPMPPQAFSRRWALAAPAGIFAVVTGPALADDPPSESAVLVILRCADVTAIQERLLRDIGTEVRKDLAIGPGQMRLSVRIFLDNSKLGQQFQTATDLYIPPPLRGQAQIFAQSALFSIREIAQVAPSYQTDFLTRRQLLQMADLYREARESMRQFCELLPAPVLAEARALFQAVKSQQF